MTQDRRCVLGVLLAAGVGFAAWPVAADSQGPGSDVLGGAPKTPDVVGPVEQKLTELRPRTAAPDSGSAPATQGSDRPAAPRGAGPSRAWGSRTSRPAGSTAGSARASGRASHAGTGSGAVRAAGSRPNGSS